jgi:hypothetical protein
VTARIPPARVQAKRLRAIYVPGVTRSAAQATAPFRDLLTRYTPVELEQKLPSGTLMGHPDLPSVRLSQQGAKDLVAYLEALRPTR